MPLYDFFKNLLGIPAYKNHKPNNDRSDNEDQYADEKPFGESSNKDFRDMWRHREENSDDMHFHIDTDPLELHKYFEYQMNEMLKSFTGMFGEDDRSFFSFGGKIPSLMPPESSLPDMNPPNPRDGLLKPGYKSAKTYTDLNKSKSDTDVDGKVNLDDLDLMLKEKPNREVQPYQRNQISSQIRSFGQSITSKTIRGPDGSVETHRIIRDSDGNEETRVTRKIGDKSYSLTTKTNKDGRQEQIEDIINIDQQEMSKFTKDWPKIDEQRNVKPDFNNLFPFHRFFKW